MPKGVQRIWPSDDEVIALARACSTKKELADKLGVKWATLSSHLDKDTKKKLRTAVDVALRRELLEQVETPQELFDKSLHKLIAGKRRMKVEDLANDLDTAPRNVREAIERLRLVGYRIPEEAEDGAIVLERVPPEKEHLHRSLLEGDRIQIGLVSDTHLCSKEHAGPELELAYDVFAEWEIAEVLHAGDLVAGMGIYRTQAQDVTHHTFDDQVEHAVAAYPRREGITTRVITGNHDIEGDFGKLGANPVLAVCNRREDMEYLGDYSAWVELPNGAWIHLLHGKGGMSYAVSYKAQKLVESYPIGRKPIILAPGHWHVKGGFEARGVEVLFPGCFEWRTPFMARLGLSPAVGFHILELVLGPDGSLVEFMPRWFRFFEGRRLEEQPLKKAA